MNVFRRLALPTLMMLPGCGMGNVAFLELTTLATDSVPILKSNTITCSFIAIIWNTSLLIG